MRAILQAFGLNAPDFIVDRIGTGHIHQTFKLTGKECFVLQRVNINVFKQPDIIASNLRIAADYLKNNFPRYPFLSSILSIHGADMVYDEEGFPWRLFHYLENTITIDKVETEEEAFSAASEFAKLTCCLDQIDVSAFKESIPHFHDLNLRYRQFEAALSKATKERTENAKPWIEASKQFHHLTEIYYSLIHEGSLRLRVTHNDTKINNVLFDTTTRKAVSVIDLDTLMPGYFIYDLGDMVRTYVSPVTEEEKDYSKIIFRKEFYDALLGGYLSQMEGVMSVTEKSAIPFAGKMMTYIMALRFLTDYLNEDTYYHTEYPGQNLVRAGNQLTLLKVLDEALPQVHDGN